MASQLSLYNGALLICGERFIAALTDETEPRRLLDNIWSDNGVKYCLEQGQWNFAMRTIQIDYDPSVAPSYGYNRAFTKPDDWINTAGVCTDEYFRTPLTRYIDEANYWYSDLDTIYIRYVSYDVNYGLNLNKWPETFREYVEHYFASKILLKLSNSEEKVTALDKKVELKLKIAKNKAAMAEPTTFPARGAWSNSRNRYPNRRDGGNINGDLIG